MSFAPSGTHTAQALNWEGKAKKLLSIAMKPFGGEAGFRYSGDVSPFDPVKKSMDDQDFALLRKATPYAARRSGNGARPL